MLRAAITTPLSLVSSPLHSYAPASCGGRQPCTTHTLTCPAYARALPRGPQLVTWPKPSGQPPIHLLCSAWCLKGHSLSAFCSPSPTKQRWHTSPSFRWHRAPVAALKLCGCNLCQTVGRAWHALSSKRGGAACGRWSDGKMYVSLVC